jgi:hypothetical protein
VKAIDAECWVVVALDLFRSSFICQDDVGNIVLVHRNVKVYATTSCASYAAFGRRLFFDFIQLAFQLGHLL